MNSDSPERQLPVVPPWHSRWRAVAKSCVTGVLFLAFIAYLRHSKDSEARLDQAQRTKDYWDRTVAELHTVRFGHRAEANEDGVAHLRRFVGRAKSGIANAKGDPGPADGIDPELVTLIRGKLDFDDASVEYANRLLNDVTAGVPRPESATLLRYLSFRSLPKTASDFIKLEKIDTDIRSDPVIQTAGETHYAKLLRDIEAMQARLNERYKAEGQTFSLPPLPAPVR